MDFKRSATVMPRHATLIIGLCVGALAAGPALAGGLIAYEIGTADAGLASAGYGARAEDASTVFTNPAGMTRLDGTQALASAMPLYANTQFSPGPGTSAALGGANGGRAVGADGWFAVGGGFISHSLSPDLKIGLAMSGNFGAALDYDDNWVGRYYVQETTLLGISLLPSIAYKVNEQLSLGASVNAMYGIYDNKVAINNIAPGFGDGQLKLDDRTWGWGVNLGLLYEIDDRTRIGLTWNSSVDLDFDTTAKFSGLAPGLNALINNRGLQGATVKIGMKAPQQVMGSIFTQVNDEWALLGSVGWQQWSKFGAVEIGIVDSTNPRSLTADLAFDDTWHVAAGAQYRVNPSWLLNFGVAYDSGFQSNSNVSPLFPVNSAWRFGIGAEQQLSKTATWGVTGEYLYGGTMDTNLQSTLPVALGGRGNIVGSYEDTSTVFVGAYANWKF